MKNFKAPEPPFKPKGLDGKNYIDPNSKKLIISVVDKFLDKFPNTSPQHRHFAKSEAYNLNHYLDLPQRIVDSIIYTMNVIETKFKQEYWFGNIVLYIEDCFERLGNPPIGAHIYKHYVLELLNNHYLSTEGITEQDIEKLIKIMEYVNKRKELNRALNIRQSKVIEVDKLYQSFVKTIPEEISYFSEKKKFLSDYKPFVLLYAFETEFGYKMIPKVDTEKELLVKIIKIIHELFEGFDCDKIFQSSSTTEIKTVQLLIEKNAKKIEKNELIKKYNSNELEFMKLIKNLFTVQAEILDMIKELKRLDSNENKSHATESKRDFENEIKIALKHIDWLSGVNYLKHKIMPEDQFKRLCSYVEHLIKHGEVPPNIEKLSHTSAGSDNIRYTFHRMHKELYTTKRIRIYFLDFLLAVFSEYNDTEKSTLKSKFSKKPQYWGDDDIKEKESK